jgi:hypothetical protein
MKENMRRRESEMSEEVKRVSEQMMQREEEQRERLEMVKREYE